MRPDRFGPPRLSASVVVRPRLLEALAARFDRRVVTVEGAAGFGKTTLLAQAVAENARHAAGHDVWLTCEPADAAAAHLAAGLVAALDGSGALDASGICDLVWQRAPVPVALILDDVHHVPHGSEGAHLLGELLGELPGNAHLVLAGRPPLPVPVSRLVVQGRALVVGEEELRLTAGELAAVAGGHGLRADALDATGGWPALAALGAAAGPDAARRFVLEEVFAGLSAPSRAALSALCLVGGGDDAMVAAGLGRPVDLVAELDGVPLVARHRDGWFRPHSLWHPITGAVLDDATAGAVRRGAAEVLAARGDLAGAGSLLLAPGLDDAGWEVARGFVAEACQVGLWVHHGSTIASWAHRLPPERREEPAGLLLLAAAERYRSGDASAFAAFETARRAAQDAGDVPVELAALSQLGHLAWWRDDLAAGADVCARAEELRRAGWQGAEPIARLGEAMLAELMGDPAGTLRAAAAIDRLALSDLLAAAADWLQARALNALGRADEAIGFAESACARAPFPAARTARVIALHQAGRIEDALAAGAQLDPTGVGSPRDRVLFGVVLASGYARLGRVDEAIRAEAVARAEHAAVAGTRVGVMVELARALVEVAVDDEPAAAARVRIAGLALEDPAVLAQHSAFLALLYVLVPECRAAWDAMDLGPDHDRTRTTARRFVAVRAGGATADAADASEAGSRLPGNQVVAALGLPWAVELAAATGDGALADTCMHLAPAATRSRLVVLAGRDDPTGAGARVLLRTVPSPPATPLVVRLLGPAVVERDGRVVDHPDWRRERVRSLLALLVTRGRTTRGELAAALWPDLDADAAHGNLRVTLRYLLRVLEPDRDAGAAPWFVRSRGESIELVSEMLVVDAREMERHLDAAAEADRTGRVGDALAALREGLAWWRGDFAVDLFDEWIDHERERLRARFLTGAVRAGELLLAHGAVEEALALGTRALQAEAWSEAAYRLVASAHLARGDRASARRTLDRCRAMLDDLGVEPEPETAMLARRIDPGPRPEILMT